MITSNGGVQSGNEEGVLSVGEDGHWGGTLLSYPESLEVFHCWRFAESNFLGTVSYVRAFTFQT